MLETFTIDTFRPRVGETFRFIVDEKWQLVTRLSEVHPWSHESAKGRDRVPFSLIFHAAPDGVVEQRTYRVENDAMEPFDLFVTPIGPDQQGMRYEAVFT